MRGIVLLGRSLITRSRANVRIRLGQPNALVPLKEVVLVPKSLHPPQLHVVIAVVGPLVHVPA